MVACASEQRAVTGKSAPQPPLLPKALGPAPDRLEDEATWDEVQASGPLVAQRELRDVTLRRSRLVEASLAGLVVERLRCENVEFVRCDLSGAIWDSAFLERAVFLDCRMTGLTLSGARLRDVRVESCGAELASFRMAKAERLHVEASILRGADFQEAALAQSRLVRSDLRGAGFRRAQLSQVELRGSSLHGLVGVASLRGAQVTADQAVVLGMQLLAETGIGVIG
ncbi:pentapeptide repeat protein [Segniliparus rotundus DSM 44985]|uniref:Pentapeptide repeat protein n=1 Tax=Segniliparus rotundus (strain ATCC BAA-972 / CDC 1076 / CIP 108378 / DSM 44985 / JCM 13578) TaxID=640132 RepID=D6ZD82_SEGRD|nr:pentapeptide repeat protein [Segniliparus rotundus DSM 44985]